MASSRTYLEFEFGQLSGLDGISWRAIMEDTSSMIRAG